MYYSIYANNLNDLNGIQAQSTIQQISLQCIVGSKQQS